LNKSKLTEKTEQLKALEDKRA